MRVLQSLLLWSHDQKYLMIAMEVNHPGTEASSSHRLLNYFIGIKLGVLK